jgi:hypothetical protein
VDGGDEHVGVTGVRLGEAGLHRTLVDVVELLDQALAQLGDERRERQAAGDERGARLMTDTVRTSAVRASRTPGYCTFTATGRPSALRARCTWPMLAAAVADSSKPGSSSASRSRARRPARARRPRTAAARWRPAAGERLAPGRLRVLREQRLDRRQELARLERAALEAPEDGTRAGGVALAQVLRHRRAVLAGQPAHDALGGQGGRAGGQGEQAGGADQPRGRQGHARALPCARVRHPDRGVAVLELLIVLAVIAVVAVLVARSRRRGSGAVDAAVSVREARAAKAATDQAVIARQAGQGGGQGGVGGGFGP